MKCYLIDTNTWIYAMNGRHPDVRSALESLPMNSVFLSTVVLGELAFGWENSQRPKETRKEVEAFLAPFQRIGIDDGVAREFGKLRQTLQSKGQPIGMNDFWIAAQALTHKLVLVTRNTREFERVSGLKLENWVAT